MDSEISLFFFMENQALPSVGPYYLNKQGKGQQVGQMTLWRRFDSRPVPGSHNMSIRLTFPILQSVIS